MARPLHAPGDAPAAKGPSLNAQFDALLLVTYSIAICFVIGAVIVFVLRAAYRWCARRHKRSAVMASLAKIPHDVYLRRPPFPAVDFCSRRRSRGRPAELCHLHGGVREWGGAVGAATMQAFVPWGVHQPMVAHSINDLPRL
ncbi:hypothetical protein OPV22_008146 [Ensete ventricosum]|uniref:Uncharacterized protein n=1 Tax=Ensete ventricosum TaxID=4639 RepID=A0AAV8RE26_ENSVE|nr:hypothetical protein OPV22_008146 [Ensete ventricosum]